MRHIIPESASADANRIVWGRAIRGFADGFVSVLLARYLIGLGFSPLEVGAIVTGTLIGSALMTLAFGLTAHRTSLRGFLLLAAGMMVATGVGFTATVWFWPLLMVAVLGTLNPSTGDVSVFLPTEQAYIADSVSTADRPRLYAGYNLVAGLAGALGALLSGAPEALALRSGWDISTAQRTGFVLYAAAGVATFALYRRLTADAVSSSDVPHPSSTRRTLPTSRRTVLELAALFSLDSAGGGFVVTSLLVLWLHLRFDLSATAAGTLFFLAGLLGACSQALAPRLALRLGLIRTMVVTHIPANCFLILAAFAPNGPVAVGLLLARALFSQMDVPARQAFVMAVVPADERPAAASVTSVPRSLASATTPLLAGALLTRTTFGWPLVIAGTVKIAYDLALLALYRDVAEEAGARRARRPDPRAANERSGP